MQIQDGKNTYTPIRDGTGLSNGLKKKMKFLDILVCHLCYRDSLLPPKEVHLTFLMKKKS